MHSLEEVRARILARLAPLPTEDLPLAAAAGRWLARPIFAPADLPDEDRSSVDGYAVRMSDAGHATPEQPVRLPVAAPTPQGECFAGNLPDGCCVRVSAGACLPKGADAVVERAAVRLLPPEENVCEIAGPVRPWQHVRWRAGDYRARTQVLPTGARLTSARLLLLSAFGIARVEVGRRPRLALLAAGVEPEGGERTSASAGVFECNRQAAAALLELAGVEPRLYPLFCPGEKALRHQLAAALAENDGALLFDGVSGDCRHWGEAFLAERDIAYEAWSLAVKPGFEVAFGAGRGQWLFGLPSDPISAWLACLLLVRPAMLHCQGAGDPELPAFPGRLAEPLTNNGGRRHYVRVAAEPDGTVRPAMASGTHGLSAMATANGLVEVPPHTTFAQGRLVQVRRWDV